MRFVATISIDTWNYAHRQHHSFQNTKEEPIAPGTTSAAPAARRRWNRLRPERHQPQPHTRGTFLCRLQPLYKKHTKLRAPASSPKYTPCDIHKAITMRAVTTTSLPQKTHRITHTDTTTHCRAGRRNHRVRNDPSRTRRTDEVPCIVGGSHSTRKNTRFRSLTSSPK